MATVKLGSRPKNFSKTVSFPMLDGTVGTIKVDYVYRTRKEFGKFVDELTEAAGVASTASIDGDGKFSMEALMANVSGSNAEYVLKVIDGWNLEAELSRESVEQLSDEVPAAVNAIMETYRKAITEGRLGN